MGFPSEVVGILCLMCSVLGVLFGYGLGRGKREYNEDQAVSMEVGNISIGEGAKLIVVLDEPVRDEDFERMAKGLRDFVQGDDTVCFLPPRTKIYTLGNYSSCKS